MPSYIDFLCSDFPDKESEIRYLKSALEQDEDQGEESFAQQQSKLS